ncbi:MAG: hypothetical protein JSW16_06755 [Dehalococcoidales bacterium]|nr:MAG: hypothetical protein JSW16_06755 [Dehalococcoidales bacterium]
MVKPSSPTVTSYTHLQLGQDVEIGIGGYYIPEKEARLEYNGREVLAIIGRAVVESSCGGIDNQCVAGNWRYAIVPGYIVNWQNTRNEEGLPVSETEPVSDQKAQGEIRRMLENSEGASIIGFW